MINILYSNFWPIDDIIALHIYIQALLFER
jgi:hypothetical protein